MTESPANSEPTTSTPPAEAAVPASPRPTPRPIPRPMPRPVPVATASPVTAPAVGPSDALLIAAAKEFGSVLDDGTVSVRDGETVRVVGQVPGVTEDEAFALYIRRYLELRGKVALLEARLTTTEVSQHDATQALTRLAEELAEPAAVGDLPALRAQLDKLRVIAKEQAAAAEALRLEARAVAVAERTVLVEQAETLAAQDPAKIQWKTASEQLRVLLDGWRDAQKNGPRIDRPTEDSLWKRFSHARTTFDRERRHFFAELEQRHGDVKSKKESLVAAAERLSTSTEWGATAGAYRDLMDQWKAAGHASRKDDDALWARFRSAQDAFFSARDRVNAEIDAEYATNLTVKESLLVEAEALLPITDINAVKTRLRDVQDRWEAAGKVPREAVQRVEARLRAVETAVRNFEEERWRKSNPEVKARADGMAAQLEAAIADLEVDLTKAQAAKNEKKMKDITDGLAARRAWLDQIIKAAEESAG